MAVDYLPKNTFELSDEEIERSSHGFLKEAYRLLRDHHILETTELWARVKKARAALLGE